MNAPKEVRRTIYVVAGPNSLRLVRASSRSVAINHVTRKFYQARPATADDVANMRDIQIEEARAEELPPDPPIDWQTGSRHAIEHALKTVADSERSEA